MFDEVVFFEEECIKRGKEEAFSDQSDDMHPLQLSRDEGRAVGCVGSVSFRLQQRELTMFVSAGWQGALKWVMRSE